MKAKLAYVLVVHDQRVTTSHICMWYICLLLETPRMLYKEFFHGVKIPVQIHEI